MTHRAAPRRPARSGTEVELVLRGELGLTRDVQHAYPEHGRVALLELRQRVPERAGLLGAARCVILRVEVEHERLARVIAHLLWVTILILQRERRCLVADL